MTGAAAVPLSTAPTFRESSDLRLRREQIRIVERTSLPGVVSSVAGIAVLTALAFQPAYEPYWSAFLGISACMALMAALWAVTLRACRRGDLKRALLCQLLANLLGTVLFFVFIERGAILAVFTALVAVSSGAMVFDDRLQRRVTALGAAVVLLSAAVSEMGIVQPIVLPPVILYAAVAVTIIFGLRNPISAFRLFNRSVEEARGEAVRSERQAHAARDEAAAHARKLEVLDGELREFMYVVSHDLRAPLINIDGFGQVLRESLDELDEAMRKLDPADPLARSWAEARGEVSEALRFISSGTKKMDGLIKGLLELSRIDRGLIRQENVPLSPLLAEILEAMEHQIRERDISVEVEPLPEIVGERVRIGQVFGNLIDNAIKYMPERGPREVRVSCQEQTDGYVFSISDTGFGIDSGSREKIFRLFKRLTADDAVAGEGIGLAAVKKIVELHGGRIWVEDGADGIGADFRFFWPRRPPVEEAADLDSAAA